jgi:diguanylate cyclase (GGDEF)-like protein/PAS domain S-box-containing protein
MSAGLPKQALIEERFRATFDRAAVGIAHIGEDGRFELVNRKLCQILGYSREELATLTVLDVSHPQDRELTPPLRRRSRAREAESFSAIKRYLRKDGSLVWMEVAVSQVRGVDGAPSYEIAVFEDITARRQAEEALQRSERRFRALIENSADGIVLGDAEGRLIYGSPGSRRTLGYGLGETVGLHAADMVHPMDRAGFEALLAAVKARPGVTHDMRVRVRHKNGGYRLVEGTLTDLCGDESVGAIVLNYRDITERVESERRRRDAELHMARLKTMYAALSAANEAILRAKSPAELFRNACEIAVETGGFLLGTVFTLDQASGLLARVAASGPVAAIPDDVPPSIDPQHPGGQSLIGRACRLDELQICNDYQNDPRTMGRRLLKRGYAVGAAAVYPLRVGDKAVGVFGLQHAEKDVFSEELTALLQRLADNISFALENFEREERFRTVVDSANEGILVYDRGHRIVAANAAAERIIRAAPGELIGKPGFTSMFPCVREDGSPLTPGERPTLVTARTGQPLTDRIVGIVRPDGAVTWVSVNTAFLRRPGDGGYYGLVSTISDVTAQRTAEQEMRRFRAALNASADSIFLVDAEAMRIIDVNDAGARNLGYERGELLGKDPEMLFANRDSDDLRAAFERLAAGSPEGVRMLRASHRRKDGSLVPVEITRRVLRSGGRTYVVGIARDISERLQNEVARATNDVVWDWNLVTDQLWWNENFRTVFGYEAHDIGAYVDSWTSRIHPDDAAAVRRDIQGAIDGLEHSWSGEYRFRRKDGSYATVHDRGLVIRDSAGRPARMIGAMVDISERKESERRIQLNALRNEGIARLGQFALDSSDLDAVFAEAVRILRLGCDVAGVVEQLAGGERFRVRAAGGEGAEANVGAAAAVNPNAMWLAAIERGVQMVSGREHFRARSPDRPWSGWLRRMASGVYVPIQGERAAFGVLTMNSLAEHAFGEDDVRFAEAVANALSGAVRRLQTQTRLAYMAEFDVLTGLPNRNLLQDRLMQTVAQAHRRGEQGAVLFIDLDRFKLINDTLGHHVGDRLIAEVGVRLMQCVRADDTVGRVSGDEFGVVLSGLQHADDAAIVAQKILGALSRPFDLEGTEAYVTASIGISVFPADGEAAETLLKNADMAMYRAKEMTRNAYCFFTAEMNRRSVAKLQLNTDLRRAMERGEFTLHYQPKVELRDGKLLGVEALLRWNHPARGMVMPADFVPALEDSGLILPVGEWVLAQACAQLRRWQAQGLGAVPVSVNLSAKQFHRADLDALVRRVLAAEGVAPGLIELEITESCLMSDPEDAVRVLGSLRDAGLKISVDDFGTGYSSLSYLTRLPLNSLKIDHSFVRDAASSRESASIVRAIIDMAHNLHFTVIAEGVETDEQVAFLRRHGCDLGQGYLFGRPVPAAQLQARLSRAA